MTDAASNEAVSASVNPPVLKLTMTNAMSDSVCADWSSDAASNAIREPGMACYALLSLATMVNFHFFPSKLYTNDRNRDLAATAAMADEDGGPLSTHKAPPDEAETPSYAPSDASPGAMPSPAAKVAALRAMMEKKELDLEEIEEIYKIAQETVLPGGLVANHETALDAARSGDWALCTYLAARCCKEDPAKLAALDERCHRTLWIEVAAPVVVDIPRGQERLLVMQEGETEPEWVPTDRLVSEIQLDGVDVHPEK
ncbi:hypothetical protein AK812_SmicGene34377 [Symbiodinium microadriaticum]|uniref:Uncharacterized protein n=1 Tax=Symbiodinium microadriaticum TaxID=2951 RepID=A0A1Q9CP73_SYMMI|nr:hypothetical protein AK812_SmicGene34377 [Symbiodinium microadriaticum]CAE7883145.1 unnamed protein product [Symbiodinium sp. KB8]CAE7886849.1 unnamed protein product [Symbiodinium microadriaticum]